MKQRKTKILVIVLHICMLCALVFCSIWYLTRDRYDGVSAGMSFTDLEELIPQECRFRYLGYYFYENQYGDTVVAEIGDDYMTIASLRCFDRITINPSRAAAKSISPGMDVYAVVSKLGTPVGTATFGMITLAFELNDGSRCVVYFNTGTTGTEMLVMDVVFKEG